MEFIAKVTQRLRQVRTLGLLRKEEGLINTTDLLVATAATVVLAAGVGGAVLSTLDEANYGKAQPDGQAIAQAIMTFYKDTGKWPGQAYHAAHAAESVFLATGTTAGVSAASDYAGGGFTLPQVANDGLSYADLTSPACAANSGEGFVGKTINGYDSLTTAGAIAGVTVLNINDFLVRQPEAADYPNWGGPYVQEITTDPWERSWVAYLTPLYCSETIGATAAAGAGNLGYAWLITGGANRTITTEATDSNLDPDGDDAGVNLGKLSTQSAGNVSQ